jgi:hypothetical protein
MAQGIYEPLAQDNSEIRLVTVLPSEDQAAPVKCCIQKAVLDSCHLYKALSYVWGNSKDTVPLWVNGEELQITRNLESALRHIRQKTEPWLVWIDAICINQSDLSERSQQVQIMRHIFQRAYVTMVWLGEERDDSDRAMDAIQRWGAARVTHGDVKSIVQNISDPFDSRDFEAVSKLLERVWWRRVWALQEVVVAKSVFLLCGDKVLNWDYLQLAYQPWNDLFLPANASVASIRDTTSVTGIIMNRYWVIAVFHRGMWAVDNNSQFTMLGLLHSCNFYDSTDPRDKIYALMGLAQDAADFDPPNYTKSVVEVYINLARRLIQRDGDLRLLCNAGSAAITPSPEYPEAAYVLQLPSWVPSWTRYIDLHRFGISIFHATLDSKAVPRFTSPSTLCAQGIVCDTITELERPQFLGAQKIRWVSLALDRGQEVYPNGLPQLQAFFRTLLRDFDGSHEKRLAADATRFYDLAASFLFLLPTYVGRADPTPGETIDPATELDYILGMLRFNRQTRDGRSDWEVLEPFLGRPFPNAVTEWGHETDRRRGTRGIKVYALAEARSTKGRSLFVTQRGYMGLSLCMMEVGDVICVFLGCPTPLILRKSGPNYILVGECFILGLMDGEVMVDLERGKVEVEELCLI